MQLKVRTLQLVAVAFIFLSSVSCKTTPAAIPFPDDDSDYYLVTEPLKLTPPKKVQFDSNEIREIKPVIKRFDINQIPARIFDSSDWMPFSKPVEEKSFVWDSLPSQRFNLENIPAKPLIFKTTLVAPPKLLKEGDANYLKIGLSQYHNYNNIKLLIDSKENLWMATENGLYRYDGQNLWYIAMNLSDTVENLQEEKRTGEICIASLRNVLIYDPVHAVIHSIDITKGFGSRNVAIQYLFIDNAENIWVTTATNGAYVLNWSRGTIRNISTNEGLSDTRCYFGMVQDNKESIWIPTAKGIDIINEKQREIKYLTAKQGLSYDTITNIGKDNEGRILVTTKNPMYKIFYRFQGPMNIINLKEQKIEHLGNADGHFMNPMDFLQNERGDILVGTADAGIVAINPQNGVIKYMNSSTDMVHSMVQDSSGNLFAATMLGIHLFGEDGFSTRHIGKYQIYSMTQDSSGFIWILYQSQGVDILNARTGLVRSLTTKQGLSNNYMENVYNYGNKLYLTSWGGLDIIDQEHHTMEHIGKSQGLRADHLSIVFADEKGRLWIGEQLPWVNSFQRFGGFEIYDPKKKTTVRLDTTNGLCDNDVTDIKTDKSNNIWISTYARNQAIDIFNVRNNTISHLLNNLGPQECMKPMCTDDSGRIWIGTGIGIFIANPAKNTLSKFQTPTESPCTNINSLNWHDGRMYVRSQEGLSIITPPSVKNDTAESGKWRVEHFGHSFGFFNQAWVYISDLVTKEGEFWWGDSGITVLHNANKVKPKQRTSITGMDLNFSGEQFYFSDQSRFIHNVTDTISSYTKNSYFLKGQLAQSPAASKKGITWDSVTGSYNLPVNLHLSYNTNFIRFHFTGTDPSTQRKMQYRYVLEGVDKKWSDVTYDPYSGYYLNLQPGQYNFKVASKGLTNIWSSPAEFSFTIMPPWWRSWWAYSIYFVSLIALVWAIVQYRSTALRRENKLLEQKVSVRTHELEQKGLELEKSFKELKATQAQLIQSEKMASLGELTAGIAHEIQNPLNFVNNFSEVNKELIEELNAERLKPKAERNDRFENEIINDIKENEEKINHHGKRADAIVKGMLQHTRMSTGQKEPTDINALCDEYLRLSYHGMRARDKDFNATFKADFDDSIGKINIVPQDIGRVLLNLYNNAFYAVMQKKNDLTGSKILLGLDAYEPIVSVSTKKLKDKIEISVKDNGPGIPPNIVEKIFQPFFTTKPTGEGTGLGLSLSYDIVKSRRGEIKVETKEGEGTTFIIQLPI